MAEQDDLILVLSTTESRDDADRLARELVDRGLVACVQIDGPICSHYRWAGETRSAQEYRLMIKSRRGVWPKLEAKLIELHPYEEPEIIMLAVDEATPGYRVWAIDQTS